MKSTVLRPWQQLVGISPSHQRPATALWVSRYIRSRGDGEAAVRAASPVLSDWCTYPESAARCAALATQAAAST